MSIWESDDSIAGAIFNESRTHRYTLWRTWGIKTNRVLFIMLNPSTADEVVLDPTIKKCIKFAKQWGFGGIDICNLFALRSTNPKLLYTHENPIGDDNDQWITTTATLAKQIIVAWGKHGKLLNRSECVYNLLKNYQLFSLNNNNDNSPEHPLYVPFSNEPKLWRF